MLQRPTVCVTRAGVGGGTPSDWEKCSGVEKGLESRQNPQRRVVGSRDGAWDFSPGFHPLPHRTGHEVFPHPALRQPSSWSIQDIHCSDF